MLSWGNKWDTNTSCYGDETNTRVADTTKNTSGKSTSSWPFGGLADKLDETSIKTQPRLVSSGMQEKPGKSKGILGFYENGGQVAASNVGPETSVEGPSDSSKWGAKASFKRKSKKGDVAPSPSPAVSIPAAEEDSISKRNNIWGNKDPEPGISEFPKPNKWSFDTTKDSNKARNGNTASPPEHSVNADSDLDGWEHYGDANKGKESLNKDVSEKPDNMEVVAVTEPTHLKGSKNIKKKPKKDTSGGLDSLPPKPGSKLKSETRPETEFNFSWELSMDGQFSKDAGEEPQVSTVDGTSLNKISKKVASEAAAIKPADGLSNWHTSKPALGLDDLSNSRGFGMKNDQKKSPSFEANRAEIAFPKTTANLGATDTFMTEGHVKRETGSKKGKKGKAAEPTFPSFEHPETPMGDFTGLEFDERRSWESPTDKNRREAEQQEEEKRKEIEEKQAIEATKKAEMEKAEKKVKPGKKGRLKTKDLSTGSAPEVIPSSCIWEPSDTIKPNLISEAPPPAPTPPRQGFTPEPDPSSISGLNDGVDDYWGGGFQASSWEDRKDTNKEVSKGNKKVGKAKAEEMTGGVFPKDKTKAVTKEEPSAKEAQLFWNEGQTAMTMKKSKASKEKEKAEGEKNPFEFDDNMDMDLGWNVDPLETINESVLTKGSKSKETNLSKATSKNSKESDKASKISDKKGKKKKGGDAKVDDAEAPGVVVLPVTPVIFSDFNNQAKDETGKDDGNEKDANADPWTFWGSTKKKTDKKEDEPKRETNMTEYAPKDWSNPPEPSAYLDDKPEPEKVKNIKSPKITTSTAKPGGKSAVYQKVRALEIARAEKVQKEKEKALDPLPSPGLEDFEPLTNVKPPPQIFGALGKAKAASFSRGATTKKKDLSPPSVEEKQASKDFIPGSFPTEGLEEDLLSDLAAPPVKKKTSKESSKLSKASKESARSQKEQLKMEELLAFDPPTPPPEVPEVPVVPDTPEAPSTPPPEPVAAKPAKKERARVVRDEGASWGFWGASPKKPVKREAKAKDDADVPSPAAKAPNGLARSKSIKTAKEKEVERTSAKSSGSDKEKKRDSRPSKPRVSGFGGFFGGLPPTRPKPVRRPSAATSKNAVIPSPPAENAPEMGNKAAKLMGTSAGKLDRRESTWGKQKGKGPHLHQIQMKPEEQADLYTLVPDPYAIDEDDMVLVPGLEGPVIHASIPKTKDVRREKSTTGGANKEVNALPFS